MDASTRGRIYSSGEDESDTVGIRLGMLRFVEREEDEDDVGTGRHTHRKDLTRPAISESPARVCKSLRLLISSSSKSSESMLVYSASLTDCKNSRLVLASDARLFGGK